jgi:hypothetical protein
VKGTGSTVAVELLPPDGADAEYARSVDNIKTRKAIPKPAGKTPSQMEQETKDYYVSTSRYYNSKLRSPDGKLSCLGEFPYQCPAGVGLVQRYFGKFDPLG